MKSDDNCNKSGVVNWKSIFRVFPPVILINDRSLDLSFFRAELWCRVNLSLCVFAIN